MKRQTMNTRPFSLPIWAQALLAGAAFAAYASQARPTPHVRSPEAVTALAEWRGKEIGVRFAEAYALLRATL